MPYNLDKYRKEDLRIVKTKINLLNALNTLLYAKNFTKITVNDICKEALVSRAAFYTHYCDKYALLKDSLLDTGQNFLDDIHKCCGDGKQIETTVGNYIYGNGKLIMNLMSESDSELLNIMSDFLIHLIGCIVTGDKLGNVEEIEKSIKNAKNNKDSLLHTSLYTFCAGGILGILLSYAHKRFPPDSKEVAVYIYKLIRLIVYNDDIANLIKYN